MRTHSLHVVRHVSSESRTQQDHLWCANAAQWHLSFTGITGGVTGFAVTSHGE